MRDKRMTSRTQPWLVWAGQLETVFMKTCLVTCFVTEDRRPVTNANPVVCDAWVESEGKANKKYCILNNAFETSATVGR